MSVPLDYFTDKPDIELYSNPKIVQRRAKLYNLDVVYSPKKNKKYRIYDPVNDKYVDFGFFGMEDWTRHQNSKRLENFRKRNYRWYDSPKYSASWASAHLLW